jgi:hypothetical protein
MAIEINRQILLTGAGFTKNFGGFLASEMWAQIFNSRQIRPHKELGKILRHDFDYESVYNRVLVRATLRERQGPWRWLYWMPTNN